MINNDSHKKNDRKEKRPLSMGKNIKRHQKLEFYNGSKGSSEEDDENNRSFEKVIMYKKNQWDGQLNISHNLNATITHNLRSSYLLDSSSSANRNSGCGPIDSGWATRRFQGAKSSITSFRPDQLRK